ncbi:hypothetical protein NGI08_23435 [Klebsiella michiganensis]|uniref:hypothetical protein n=1 Tax=Klebsiella/Raoultella group TaxID=2890311 RepID=UPI0012B862F9|nr:MULTISPECIES: hypothetical protein [Klebsiella/Raoultella group]MBR7606728.1 hypothetical protein [Klebsiella pneumoniae]MBZ7757040.1 hypothetical protein [Raoultella ornithinolytica]MCF6690003.1 hypothetical protein [Raoultella terrigena]MEB8081734.1 hypothetical protein [Klebsiella michiganensis]
MSIENESSSFQPGLSATDNGERHEVIVTGCVTKHGRGIHFCNNELLSGANHNLWFPLNSDDDWFSGIERVLVMNGLAENVVNLTPLNDGKDYHDWKVMYNCRII